MAGSCRPHLEKPAAAAVKRLLQIHTLTLTVVLQSEIWAEPLGCTPLVQSLSAVCCTPPFPAWFWPGCNGASAATVCDYCSTGDLYTYWQMIGQFSEDTARVFAAELACALGAYTC